MSLLALRGAKTVTWIKEDKSALHSALCKTVEEIALDSGITLVRKLILFRILLICDFLLADTLF